MAQEVSRGERIGGNQKLDKTFSFFLKNKSLRTATIQEPVNESRIVSSAAMSTSPLAKRQRLLQQQQISSITTLPFETLFVVASFLGPQDALALGVGMCSRELLESCALWQHIARNVDPILEEIFVSVTTKPTVIGGITVTWLSGLDGSNTQNLVRDDSSGTTTPQNTCEQISQGRR